MCFADIQHQSSELLLRHGNWHALAEVFEAWVCGAVRQNRVFRHAGDGAVDNESRGPVVGLNQAQLSDRRKAVSALEGRKTPRDLTDPSLANFFSEKRIHGVRVRESTLPGRGAVFQRLGMRRIGLGG